MIGVGIAVVPDLRVTRRLQAQVLLGGGACDGRCELALDSRLEDRRDLTMQRGGVPALRLREEPERSRAVTATQRGEAGAQQGIWHEFAAAGTLPGLDAPVDERGVLRGGLVLGTSRLVLTSLERLVGVGDGVDEVARRVGGSHCRRTSARPS